MHTYFLPSDDIIKFLLDALKKGVSVTIVLPGRYETIFLRWVIFARLKLLYDNNSLNLPIKTFIWPGKLHSKTIIADDNKVVLGSYNFDNRSKEYNYESSVIVSDINTVKDIVSDTKEIISGSHVYEFRLPWYSKYNLKFIEIFVAWVSRFL